MIKSYTTKLRPTTEYTYTAMLSGIAGDISEILDHEGFKNEILNSCDIPDNIPEIFIFHKHTFYTKIVFIRTKVNATDMRALLEELY